MCMQSVVSLLLEAVEALKKERAAAAAAAGGGRGRVSAATAGAAAGALSSLKDCVEYCGLPWVELMCSLGGVQLTLQVR
jgi:hypothetical protein